MKNARMAMLMVLMAMMLSAVPLSTVLAPDGEEYVVVHPTFELTGSGNYGWE